MKIGLGNLLAVSAAVAAMSVASASQLVHAQQDYVGYGLRYNSGQAVQPYFEGWSKNPDGSFDMHFGYLNRNYVEEVAIPLGPQNNIEPGGPDRGQPTYFYPRRSNNVFKVTVPKDFGKKELIWTLNFRGKNLKAVGWLQPEWEIALPGTPRDASEAAARKAEGPKNQAPTVSFESGLRVTLPATLAVTATIADDGLPDPKAKPAAPRRVAQGTVPILQPTKETVEAPVNVPDLPLGPRGARIAPRAPAGPSVTYKIWRAPASVQFDPLFAVPKDGKAVTTMTFTQPGEYVLRARATDGALADEKELKITVVAAP